MFNPNKQEKLILEKLGWIVECENPLKIRHEGGFATGLAASFAIQSILAEHKKDYFLDTDGDSHWFVIPIEKQKEWYKWAEMDKDDPASWDVPKYAYEVGGHPCRIHFKDWHQDD